MNLWKETIQVLKENNKLFDDVNIICGNDFQITKENFMEIAQKTDYDSGYGGQEVARDLKIIGNNFMMIRNEYDGSEWWEFESFSIPKNIKIISKLADSDWAKSYSTLKEMQPKELYLESNEENKLCK